MICAVARFNVAMTRQITEGTLLCGTRNVLGDEPTADLLFRQDYDAGFCGRHTNQLAGLWAAKFTPDGYDVDGGT